MAGPRLKPEARAFKDNVVKNDYYKFAIEAIEDVHKTFGPDPYGLIITANSGVGKTTILEGYEKIYEVAPSKTKSKKHVVLIDSPHKISTEMFASALLEKLGDPDPTSGKPMAQLIRLKKYIVELEVEIVFVDEFQDMMPKAGKIDENSRAVKFVKWLMNNLEIPIVLAGKPEVNDIRKFVDHAETRFNNTFKLYEFNCNTPKDTKILKRYYKTRISKIPRDITHLNNPDTMKKLLLASHGINRTLCRILTTAIDKTKNNDCITDEVLEDAWLRVSSQESRNKIGFIPFRATTKKVLNKLQELKLHA
ncbi:MAG: hypothetical protein ACI83B_002556 [Sediminicola sp.]|jgi:hypothetical protein